jgi:hypothetical protein
LRSDEERLEMLEKYEQVKLYNQAVRDGSFSSLNGSEKKEIEDFIQ